MQDGTLANIINMQFTNLSTSCLLRSYTVITGKLGCGAVVQANVTD